MVSWPLKDSDDSPSFDSFAFVVEFATHECQRSLGISPEGKVESLVGSVMSYQLSCAEATTVDAESYSHSCSHSSE